MKISKNGQYALLSVVDIAIHEPQGCQRIADIASRNRIDERYLGQILFKLKNAGVITGVRGKNGGYLLTRPAQQITAAEVVRAIEGDLAPTRCSADPDSAKCCESFKTCLTIGLWNTLARQINQTLSGVTIAELANRYQRSVQNETA